MRKKNPLAQAESLLGHFEPVNVDCAYTLTYALGHHDTEFLLLSPNAITTARQIYNGSAYSKLAKKIPIKFYGGPLGGGKWYTGTLHTFLIDCIAAKIQMEGFEKTRQILRMKSCPF